MEPSGARASSVSNTFGWCIEIGRELKVCGSNVVSAPAMPRTTFPLGAAFTPAGSSNSDRTTIQSQSLFISCSSS